MISQVFILSSKGDQLIYKDCILNYFHNYKKNVDILIDFQTLFFVTSSQLFNLGFILVFNEIDHIPSVNMMVQGFVTLTVCIHQGYFLGHLR